MEIEDIRRYVFPLVVGEASEDPQVPFRIDRSSYLGTGFFVSKNGIALTAAHLVPDPSSLGQSAFVAVIFDGQTPRAHKVVAATVPNGTDIAILKISNYRGPFLPLKFRQIHMGEDVQAIGIPDHSTWGEDRDYRTLKGYVTRARRRPEVSFAAPRGLSGSPVFTDNHVVGVVSGNYRSEALEDQIEEVEERTPGVVKTVRVEIKAVVNYGVIELVQQLENFKHEQFGDNVTFSELLKRKNSE